MIRLLGSLGILVVLFIGPLSAFQERSLPIDFIDIQDDQVIDLSSSMAWCAADPELDLAAIISGGCEFSRAQGYRDIYHGLSAKAFWMRFVIKNSSPTTEQRYLQIGHPRLESVTLFSLTSQAEWEPVKTGLKVRPRDRSILTETPTFPISIESQSTKIFYVKIDSETAIDLSATLMTSWALSRSSAYSRLFLLGSIGAAVLACCFCCIVYFYLRDIRVLYFAGTLISLIINDAGYTGLTATFLVGQDSIFAISSQGITVSSGLIFYTLLIVSFVPEHPILNRIKQLILSLLFLHALIALWGLTVSYREALFYFTITSGGIVSSISIFVLLASYLRVTLPITLIWALLPALVIILFRLMSLVGYWPPSNQYVNSFAWILVIASPFIIVSMIRTIQSQRSRIQEFEIDAKIRSQFLAHISHDFRTPLSTIIHYTQLLGSSSKRVTTSEAIIAIRKNSFDLLFLIDTVLDYVKNDKLEIDLKVTAFKFDEFIEDITTRGQYLAKIKDNSFQTQINGSIPSIIKTDQGRLRQVINNFLSNASKYTENGTICFRCDVNSISKYICELSFYVADTGIGIDEDDQKLIFLPNVRGKQIATIGTDGFGIGLALAKKIVELMGSEIQLHSSPGKGSTFSFSIICETIPEPYVDSHSPLSEGGRKRLLLIDDDPASLAYFCEILESQNVELCTASSGEEAKRFFDRSLDLIITDQYMDNGDGWSMLLQAEKFSVPAILVSSGQSDRPKTFPESLNFAAIFRKPIKVDSFIQEVEKILSVRIRRVELSSYEVPPLMSDVPNATLLAPLLRMVEQGAVTEIQNWLAEMQEKHPQHNDFWALIFAAYRRLDFEELQNLLHRILITHEGSVR